MCLMIKHCTPTHRKEGYDDQWRYYPGYDASFDDDYRRRGETFAGDDFDRRSVHSEQSAHSVHSSHSHHSRRSSFSSRSQQVNVPIFLVCTGFSYPWFNHQGLATSTHNLDAALQTAVSQKRWCATCFSTTLIKVNKLRHKLLSWNRKYRYLLMMMMFFCQVMLHLRSWICFNYNPRVMLTS